MTAPPALARSGAMVAGGLAAALMLAWVLAGDARAVRRAPSDPEAVDLLRETAAAARRTPYEGIQFRTTWNSAGPVTSTAQVAHATAGHVARGMSALHDTPEQAPAGWLPGFSPAMLDLLARNYAVVRAADGIICGRKARIVEARRAGGGVAGRFWIDAGTGLMLHRELLDGRGRTVSATGFDEVRIAQPRIQPLAAPARQAPWQDRLAGAELAALRRDGWTVPDRLPGGFVLTDARQDTAPGGPTVHLSYSDGLLAVSVFVQRGVLNARRLGGWQRRGDGTGAVLWRESRQRWTVWSSEGYVYTVLTDAPQGTSDSVVAALPHGDPGLWARMGRGLARIGAWASPWN